MAPGASSERRHRLHAAKAQAAFHKPAIRRRPELTVSPAAKARRRAGRADGSSIQATPTSSAVAVAAASEAAAAASAALRRRLRAWVPQLSCAPAAARV